MVAAAVALANAPRPGHSAALVVALRDADAAQLVGLIPTMAYGAPATNVTLPARVAAKIEESAARLEATGQRNLATNPAVVGSWRLLYSNSREITNLAADLPLGFVLGSTFQPVSADRFENQGSVLHPFGFARGSTRLAGRYRVAAAGSLNAAGVANSANNRLDVDFEKLEFSLDELLGVPSALRKVITPMPDPSAPQTAIDVTWLSGDGSVRVTRGGDGALFVLKREESSEMPMLSDAEFEALLQEEAPGVITGRVNANAPPEYNRLVR